MQFSRKFKEWQFSTLRLETFSDAVFAIVITLLVLDLRIPHIKHSEQPSEVWLALRHVAPLFFSWAISFLFVAIIWLQHHQILHMAVKSDYGVIWINNILLFFVCLLPFPTSLMGAYPHSPVAVTFWGLTVAAVTTVLVWFYYYNTKNYLQESYSKTTVLKHVRLALLAGPMLYFIAAILAWVSVYISFAIYALVPFLYLLPLDKPVHEPDH